MLDYELQTVTEKFVRLIRLRNIFNKGEFRLGQIKTEFIQSAIKVECRKMNNGADIDSILIQQRMNLKIVSPPNPSTSSSSIDPQSRQLYAALM